MNIERVLRSVLPSADKYVEGAEKLLDTGFESWVSDTNLEYWIEETSQGSSTITKESVEKHGGLYSAKATIIADAHAGIYQPGILLTPGKRVRVSFWYKTPADGVALFWCYAGPSFESSLNSEQFYDMPEWIAGYGSVVLPPSTSFRNHVIEFDLHEDYDQYLFSLSGNKTGEYYFDDFSVVELEPAGIVSCWVPGGGTRAKDIVRGNHGRSSGGVVTLPDGITWSFNGTTGSIGPLGSAPPGAMTVGFWLKRTTQKTSQPIVSLNNGATNPPAILVDGGVSPYEHCPVAWLGTSNWQYWSKSDPTDLTKIGHWYFYTFAVPGSGLSDIEDSACYINGVPQAKSIGLVSGGQSGRSLVAVGKSLSVYNACPVAMPFVANRVLTQQEVQNIYRETKGLFFPRG